LFTTIPVVVLTTTQTTAFVPTSLPQYRTAVATGTTKDTITSTITLHAADLDVDIKNLPNGTDGSISNGVVSKESTTSAGTSDNYNVNALPGDMLELPRHSSHEGVNKILVETEGLLRAMHKHSMAVDSKDVKRSMTPTTNAHYDKIFANTYVDLGKVDTVGFDYDYTLVHYTEELLDLLYDMALSRLVNDRHYPPEMLESGLKYDPFFSIRGTQDS
jgi:hypothetical protein